MGCRPLWEEDRAALRLHEGICDVRPCTSRVHPTRGQAKGHVQVRERRLWHGIMGSLNYGIYHQVLREITLPSLGMSMSRRPLASRPFTLRSRPTVCRLSGLSCPMMPTLTSSTCLMPESSGSVVPQRAPRCMWRLLRIACTVPWPSCSTM